MKRKKTNIRFLLTAGVLLILASFSIHHSAVSGQEKMKTKTVGGIEFVYIPGGEFMMGPPEGYSGSDKYSKRMTKVRPFWIGKYEVTQKQYLDIMGTNPSYFKGDNLPVENVSWYDAKIFCHKFGAKNSVGVRIPYETEWEYACRAGSKSKYYWGDAIDGKYCWYSSNSDYKTHPVGQKLPNAWGLFDMSGNVWEWCEDCYSVTCYGSSPFHNPKGPASCDTRVLRGGSWFTNDINVHTAFRSGDCAYPCFDSVGKTNGFRLVFSGEN